MKMSVFVSSAQSKWKCCISSFRMFSFSLEKLSWTVWWSMWVDFQWCFKYFIIYVQHWCWNGEHCNHGNRIRIGKIQSNLSCCWMSHWKFNIALCIVCFAFPAGYTFTLRAFGIHWISKTTLLNICKIYIVNTQLVWS